MNHVFGTSKRLLHKKSVMLALLFQLVLHVCKGIPFCDISSVGVILKPNETWFEIVSPWHVLETGWISQDFPRLIALSLVHEAL